MKIKKFLKIILVILIILLVMVGGYFIYLFKAYHRVNDRVHLETKTSGAYSYFKDDEALHTGRYYNIITYNIGYGAYTDDYSFFMDGGKESWAKSKEGLMANLCEITDVINNTGSDFVLLQEVDTDSTRTFHVNELDMINQFIKGYYYAEAPCFDSPFLFYPILEPHGQCRASMVTYSKGRIAQSVRRSLPVPTNITKFFDMDRCYIVSRIPLANEKTLVIYNVHMSAYTDDESVKNEQLDALLKDMESEYKLGNYVICGGDFNHNLKNVQDSDVPSWAARFPREKLPKGFSMGIDYATSKNVEHNSCRNVDKPYDKDTTFTVTTDGFIVSDNVRVNFYANSDGQYKNSDHDPVFMQFFLRD